MKKIISISLIALLCSANTNINTKIKRNKLEIIPLTTSILSTENGGEISAIEAYSDGIGLIVSGDSPSVYPMNELVYKYGEEALNNNVSLKEYVLENGTESEKELANLMGNDNGSTETIIGASCDDGNDLTYGDIYLDTKGTCSGYLNNKPNNLTINNWENLILGETKTITFNANDIDNEQLNYSYEIKNTNTEETISANLGTNKEFNVSIIEPFFKEGNSYKITLNVTDNKDVVSLESNSINLTKLEKIKILPNGTLTCPDATPGTIEMLNGQKYYIAGTKEDIVSIFKGRNGILDNGGVDDVRLNRICTTHVTDMSLLFGHNMYFGQNPNINVFYGIGSFDTSNVTNMYGMFYLAQKFNEDINNWDVSKVTNMKYMFYMNYDFNKPLNKWNVSNVTDMGQMFREALSFNQNINDWDVSKVTDMHYMFYYARHFNQPLYKWNVSNVTQMYQMFAENYGFGQNISAWNVSKVKNMYRMFYKASNFNSNISNWNVNNVTSWGDFRFSSGLIYANTPPKFR